MDGSLRRDMDVYLFVVQYKRQHDGNSPSLREISHGCGIRSTSHVYECLVRLMNAGRITLKGTRSIEVSGGCWTIQNGSCEL